MRNKRKFLMQIGIVWLCQASGVLAHDQSGSLGAQASATDYYELECFDDGNGSPEHLFFEVRGDTRNTAVQVSGQVVNGSQAASATDHTSGDSSYSPQLKVVHEGDNDVYRMVIDKNGPGVAQYSLQYHCETGNGVHTGTSDLKFLQVQ
jgi:hypothetical protein